MRTSRLLGVGLGSLALLIAGYVVLGPLVLDVIHFRTSASGLNQIRGGDLAALVIVVPVCLIIGCLAWRGHAAAPTLALAPTIFAMYTYSQLILGNEFLHLPGNVERFFPLLLAIFLIAAALTLRCWSLARPGGPPSRRLDRGSGILLVVIAVFIVLGIHGPSLVDAFRDSPAGRRILPRRQPSGWSNSTTSASSPRLRSASVSAFCGGEHGHADRPTPFWVVMYCLAGQ